MVVRQKDEWGFRRDEWPKAGKEGKFVFEAGFFWMGITKSFLAKGIITSTNVAGASWNPFKSNLNID